MSKFEKNNVCALIPAAGKSYRMKTYKPLLKFDKTRTFIEKIVDEFLNFGSKQIIVVVNQEIYNEICKLLSKKSSAVCIVVNDKLEFERFYSIKLGLNKITEKTYCFIHNCDNPFINQKILTTIFENKISDGYVSPTFNIRGGHPILISKPIINNIVHSFKNDANFKEVISGFPVKKIDINNENILVNVNTQSDYQNIREILKIN